MTQHAAVDFLADSSTGAVVDAAWCHAARADGITRVRSAIQADGSGMVHWPLMAQGARAWQGAEIDVDGVCAYEYLPPYADDSGVTHWPNEPVGAGSYRLTSRYIERFRLQLESHAPGLLAAGIRGIYAWNEPQVGLALPGDNCPPGTRLKRDAAGNPLDGDGKIVDWRLAERTPDPGLNRSCLAPEVYASLVWQTCHSLAHAGCGRRIAGAFNILPTTGLDPRNAYLLAFMGRMYAHLAACGVRPNWTHLGLTIYGYWTAQTLQHVHDVLRAYMAAHGDDADLVVGEFGVRNEGADSGALLTTALAMETVFGPGNAAFFMRPGLVPYLGPVEGYGDYGWRTWRQDGTKFAIGADYPLGATIRKWAAT